MSILNKVLSTVRSHIKEAELWKLIVENPEKCGVNCVARHEDDEGDEYMILEHDNSYIKIPFSMDSYQEEVCVDTFNIEVVEKKIREVEYYE